MLERVPLLIGEGYRLEIYRALAYIPHIAPQKASRTRARRIPSIGSFSTSARSTRRPRGLALEEKGGDWGRQCRRCLPARSSSTYLLMQAPDLPVPARCSEDGGRRSCLYHLTSNMRELCGTFCYVVLYGVVVIVRTLSLPCVWSRRG